MHITPEQYDDLYWRLALAERVAIIWRLHVEALFGYKALAVGHGAPGLAERVERVLAVLAGLKAEAGVSEADPRIGKDPPASAGEIREFVSDLHGRMAKLASNSR